MLNIVKQAHKYLKRTAIVADNRSYTYEELLFVSGDFAHILLEGQADLNELNAHGCGHAHL